MNFFLIDNQRINLNNIIQYYPVEHKRDTIYFQMNYYIVFITVSNNDITIFFNTEKERNAALQKLDDFTKLYY